MRERDPAGGAPRAYLAGAMERAPDRGRAWRDRVLSVLDEIGHAWFHPNEEETTIVPPEARERFGEWKASGHPEFTRLMQRIIEHDLAGLEAADYVICYWDAHALGSGGTPAELTFAHRWGKPVYLVLDVPREDVSSWVLGCASHVFESLDDLSDHLRRECAS